MQIHVHDQTAHFMQSDLDLHCLQKYGATFSCQLPFKPTGHALEMEQKNIIHYKLHCLWSLQLKFLHNYYNK